MFDNAKLNKEYRKATMMVVIGAVLLLLAIGLLGVSFLKASSNRRNAEHLNDAMYRDDDRVGRIAYLDVLGFYQFATYGDDLGYYIAYDEDYAYIISIKEKDWDYFADQFDDKNRIVLWGYTDEIPSEAKSYAIDALNDEYPDEHYTLSDFDNIFGDLMLSAGRDASVKGLGGWIHLYSTYITGAFLAALFGVITLLLGLSNRKSFGVLNEDPIGGSRILDELNEPATQSYDNGSLYLTDHYLVDTKGSIKAVDYDDIFWMYVTNHRTNGIRDYNYLNIVTKEGKTFNCFNAKAFGKKNRENTEESHTEVMNKLLEKNPDIRVGYVQENVEAYNQLLKDLKHKADL
ncbi:MAG: hypothetical protein IKS69_00710 [Erysipelotrichaceae bacterium]|nr:hypothetical protein [Erysipelotrichaceae bacterium]